MTTDPRALIAEGRKHDEAMSPPSWEFDADRHQVLAKSNLGRIAFDLVGSPNCAVDGPGIAWLRTNLGALLDGYASALDEIERLHRLYDGVTNGEDRKLLVAERDRLSATCATLRTSRAEQALVIEQQDRDMARLKKFEPAVAQGFLDLSATNQQINRLRSDLAAARDMNRHFEQERDAWPAAYKQRAAQTDARIKELEAGPPGWICPTCKDPNCG